MSPRSTAPTEQDIILVRDSFDRLVPAAGLAADLLYQRLFELAPGLRAMFPKDMRDQKRSLILALAAAVQGLFELDRLVPQVKALGARHARYGVEPEHYRIFGDALIWAVELCLGKTFTPDVRRAWIGVYAMLAALMQGGAEDAITMRAAE